MGNNFVLDFALLQPDIDFAPMLIAFSVGIFLLFLSYLYTLKLRRI